MNKVLGHLEQNRNYYLAGLGALLLVGFLGYRLIHQWVSRSANSSTGKASDIGQRNVKSQQAQTTNSSTVTITPPGTTTKTTSNVAQTTLNVKSKEQEQPKLYISDGPLAQIDNKEVYGIGGTDLIVKFTVKPNVHPIHWEYFAYLISEALGLKVVPFVAFVNAGELSDEKSLDRYPGVKELLLDRFKSQIMILQPKIDNLAGASAPRRYDLSNFQRVVFFNLIIGRLGDSHDSRVDKANILWEISNSKCGYQISKIVSSVIHLYQQQKSEPILDDLIKDILKLDPTCLDTIEKMAREKSQDTYDPSKWANIKENLALVQCSLRFLKSGNHKILWPELLADLKIF